LGRTQRYQALNEVIVGCFASAGIPVSKEQTGIDRDSVKRPDGIKLVPWQSGRVVAWDVTVATTFAYSYKYLPASSVTAAAAAEGVASIGSKSHSHTLFSFQPVAAPAIDKVRLRPYHFRSGPTSGPTTRQQEAKKVNYRISNKISNMFIAWH